LYGKPVATGLYCSPEISAQNLRSNIELENSA